MRLRQRKPRIITLMALILAAGVGVDVLRRISIWSELTDRIESHSRMVQFFSVPSNPPSRHDRELAAVHANARSELIRRRSWWRF